MGITWDKTNVERALAALLAAHPDLNPDYRTMAVFFGRGASYDALYHRFKEYRRVADEMTGSGPRPAAPSTPIRRRSATTYTPRSGKNGVTKPASAKKSGAYIITPTKPKTIKPKSNAHDPIIIDDDDDGDNKDLVKKEETIQHPIIEMSEMFEVESKTEEHAKPVPSTEIMEETEPFDITTFHEAFYDFDDVI